MGPIGRRLQRPASLCVAGIAGKGAPKVFLLDKPLRFSVQFLAPQAKYTAFDITPSVGGFCVREYHDVIFAMDGTHVGQRFCYVLRSMSMAVRRAALTKNVIGVGIPAGGAPKCHKVGPAPTPYVASDTKCLASVNDALRGTYNVMRCLAPPVSVDIERV